MRNWLIKKGGDVVAKGNYWNVMTGERFKAPGTLPGKGKATYFRATPWALPVVGPLLGLALAIFMPLIVILAIGWVAGEWFVHAASNVAHRGKAFAYRHK